MSEIIIVPTGNAASVTVNETGKETVEIMVVTAVILQETDLSPYYSKEETNALLDTETTARQNADDTLQQNIDTETTTRTTADTTLQNNIDAEASARTSADTTLQNNIDAEASARTSADTTLQNNIDAETSARTSADTTLQEQINTKVDKITAKGLSTEDYTTTEKTKLAGITDGATANQTDAYLLERANHTGAQDAGTITGTKTSSFISDFADAVKNTILTGIDLTVNAVISATDTVLSALGKLQKQITDHKNDTSNPHTVTKSQVGLSNADNTSDANKPVSTSQQTALNLKLNKAGDTLTGTIGYGFIGFPAQSINPSAPVSGVKIFADNFGNLSQSNTAGETTTLAKSPDIQIYNTPGGWVWTKPAGAKTVEVICIASGGGGGSGRKGAVNTVRCGAGSGGSGGYSEAAFLANNLPSTVSINVPAGGAGGAAQSVNSSNGNNGGGGAAALFGIYLRAIGASAGGGGTASGGAAGANGNGSKSIGVSGTTSSTSGGIGNNGATANFASSSGASGGGITNANVPNNGGSVSGSILFISTSLTASAAGSASTTGTGGDGRSGVSYPEFLLGVGGGGGGASTAGNAGAGGNGGKYGAGGGGGGAATDNVGNSGKGGDGGDDIVIVITYF